MAFEMLWHMYTNDWEQLCKVYKLGEGQTNEDHEIQWMDKIVQVRWSEEETKGGC